MFKILFLNSAVLMLFFSCSNPLAAVKSPDWNLRDQSSPGLQNCSSESSLLAAGIVGGTRVTEADRDSKNVVMLYSDREVCTATAISPRVLLTAAHCITGSRKKSWVGLYSSLSCESGFDTRYNTVKIKEFVIHPDYMMSENSDELTINDIALVFLEEALPASYPIFQIANPKDVDSRSSLYFWGYGDTNYKAGGAGILRKTKLVREDFEILKEKKKIKFNQSSGHGICQGDSGGPAFVKINSELQILGINSYVRGAGTDESTCANEGFATLTNSYLEWIKSNLFLRNEYLKESPESMVGPL